MLVSSFKKSTNFEGSLGSKEMCDLKNKKYLHSKRYQEADFSIKIGWRKSIVLKTNKANSIWCLNFNILLRLRSCLDQGHQVLWLLYQLSVVITLINPCPHTRLAEIWMKLLKKPLDLLIDLLVSKMTKIEKIRYIKSRGQGKLETSALLLLCHYS